MRRGWSNWWSLNSLRCGGWNTGWNGCGGSSGWWSGCWSFWSGLLGSGLVGGGVGVLVGGAEGFGWRLGLEGFGFVGGVGTSLVVSLSSSSLVSKSAAVAKVTFLLLVAF